MYRQESLQGRGPGVLILIRSSNILSDHPISSDTKLTTLGPGAWVLGAALTLPHDQSPAEFQSAEHGEALLR